MASGLIATILGTAAVTYTPTVLTKINISYYSTGTPSILVNSVTTLLPTTSILSSFSMWLTPNVPVTFTGAATTSMFISSLESGY